MKALKVAGVPRSSNDNARGRLTEWMGIVSFLGWFSTIVDDWFEALLERLRVIVDIVGEFGRTSVELALRRVGGVSFDGVCLEMSVSDSESKLLVKIIDGRSVWLEMLPFRETEGEYTTRSVAFGSRFELEDSPFISVISISLFDLIPVGS